MMFEPKLACQMRMPEDVVPLPEKREVYRDFAEMFESKFVDDEWKLNWIAQVQRFETLNGVTKKRPARRPKVAVQ